MVPFHSPKKGKSMNPQKIAEHIARIEESLKSIKAELPSQKQDVRRPSTRLVVSMNGDEIDFPVARDTFIEVISRIGVERVRRYAPDLVFTSEPEYTWRPIGSYYVLVGGKVGSTNAKKRHLMRIARALDIPLHIKTVANKPRPKHR